MKFTLAHELVHIIERHCLDGQQRLSTTLSATSSGLMAVYAWFSVAVSSGMWLWLNLGVAAVLGGFCEATALLLPLPRPFTRYRSARFIAEEWSADHAAISLTGSEEAFDMELQQLLTFRGPDMSFLFSKAGGIYASAARRLYWITGNEGWLDPLSPQWEAVVEARASVGKSTTFGIPTAPASVV